MSDPISPENPNNATGESKTEMSGLDMGPTIAWYTENQDTLLQLLEQRLPTPGETPPPYTVEGLSHIHISQERIAALIALFPAQAHERSRLQTGKIIGKPPLYFANTSTPGDPQATSYPAEALSLTAIIPSYVHNTSALSSNIELYELPDPIPQPVKEIIHAQGLVHEYAHTIATQALYQEDYRIKLPDKTLPDGKKVKGEEVDGIEYLLGFAKVAEQYDPISHYSSFYRKPGEEFPSLVAIEEELVESITAWLLGFAYCGDDKRSLDPFEDRADVGEIIDNFLNAEELPA